MNTKALTIAVLVLLTEARHGAAAAAATATTTSANHHRHLTVALLDDAEHDASDNSLSPRQYQRTTTGDSSFARRLPFLSRSLTGRATSRSLLDLRGGGGGAEKAVEAEPSAKETSPEASELYLPGLLETVLQRIRKVR
jgi:hypothetical protein